MTIDLMNTHRHNFVNGLAMAALALTLWSAADSAKAGETIEVSFLTHVDAGLSELDVFVADPEDPTAAYRVTPETRDTHMNDMVYASAGPVFHNPFDAEAVGPHPKGRPLDMTLGQYLGAKGTARITCDGGRGTVEAAFTDLVPNGVYTMWYAFIPQPATKPFTGTLDLPLGARDGSQAGFEADGHGTAAYTAAFDTCLQMSGEQLMAVLAIAWHSDGKTYGSSPGSFGDRTHIQVFAPLPKADAVN